MKMKINKSNKTITNTTVSTNLILRVRCNRPLNNQSLMMTKNQSTTRITSSMALIQIIQVIQVIRMMRQTNRLIVAKRKTVTTNKTIAEAGSIKEQAKILTTSERRITILIQTITSIMDTISMMNMIGGISIATQKYRRGYQQAIYNIQTGQAIYIYTVKYQDQRFYQSTDLYIQITIPMIPIDISSISWKVSKSWSLLIQHHPLCA